MTGHQKITLLAGIGSALINIILNPILILWFGAIGGRFCAAHINALVEPLSSLPGAENRH